MLAAPELQAQVVFQGALGLEDGGRLQRLRQGAARHLHHRQQLGPLGRAQAFEALQIGWRGVQQAGESAAVLQHVARKRHHAAAFVAGAQQQRQQFTVGQCCGTACQQLLSRPLLGRQVLHGYPVESKAVYSTLSLIP